VHSVSKGESEALVWATTGNGGF